MSNYKSQYTGAQIDEAIQIIFNKQASIQKNFESTVNATEE